MVTVSELLLDEPLLCYQPALVRRLGLADAAVVQQLHYWSQRSTNIYEGQRWVYKTYDEWSAEIGISAKAVRGACDRLRKAGVVLAVQSPLDSRDKTLWWRIDHVVLAGDEAPRPSGSPSAPTGSPTAAGGSSHAGVPGRTETTAENTKKKNARGDRKTQVPDDFPDELRPHAREVMRVLKAIAADHPTAKAVWPREVALAVMAYPRHPLVRTAHAMAGWAVDPPRQINDVASTYRTFLGRERELEATERLADDGTPTSARASTPGNVHPIHGGRRQSEADRVEAQIQALRAE